MKALWDMPSCQACVAWLATITSNRALANHNHDEEARGGEGEAARLLTQLGDRDTGGTYFRLCDLGTAWVSLFVSVNSL